MKTTMYLIRHAAAEANLAQPAHLQGRRHNPPLARLGVRQAELTRDFLAVRPIDHCYSSPLLRALQTASIIAAPHGLAPFPLDNLVESDVGSGQGLDWPAIGYLDADGCRRFVASPARFGYPDAESYGDLHARVTLTLEDLFTRHTGQGILVVAHYDINRIYLAGLLGLGPEQAGQVQLDNCGISVAVRDDSVTTVSTLNASFHLQGIAA